MFSYRYHLLSKENRNYIELFLNNLKGLNKSEHTILNYRADLEKFCHWIEKNKQVSIQKVNGDVIGEYQEFLLKGGAIYRPLNSNSQVKIVTLFSLLFLQTFFKKRTRKPILFFQNPMSVSSRRRHLSTIKNFYEFLKQYHEDKSNKFLKNPVKSKIHGITLKDIDVENTKMITHQEFEKVFENAWKAKEKFLLLILYYGGLRLSEVTNLKFTDFDYESKSVTFYRKGGSKHKLYLKNSDAIFNSLNFLLSQSKDQQIYIFESKDNRPVTSRAVYNLIMKLLKISNIREEITPHSFRKACATNLYKETKDLLFVRDYLNHSDAKVTQTYIDTKSYLI